MSASRFTHLVGVLAVLVVCACFSEVACAQPDAKAVAVLANSTKSYEDQMNALRARIEKAIQVKIDGTKGDNAKINAAIGEKAAFKSTGAWPDVPGVAAMKAEAARAAKQFATALGEAKKTFDKAGDKVMVEEMNKEIESFESQNDLVPWSPNLIEKEPADSKTLLPGGNPMTIDLSKVELLKGETEGLREYRIQIRGKRTGDAGKLKIDLPLTTGSLLTVESEPGKSKELRVILTVRDGFVGADLGVARPIQLPEATEHRGQQLTLSASGEAIDIETVCVKPVVGGQPETSDAATGRRERGAAPADPLAKDASGQGECFHDQFSKAAVHATVKVIERNGNSAVLMVVLTGTGESFRVTVQSRDGSLTVSNAEQTRPPANTPAFRTTENDGGSGSIANGILNLTWTVRGNSNRRASNRPWTVVLSNIKMD